MSVERAPVDMEPQWRDDALNGDIWAKKKAAGWTKDPETQMLLAQTGIAEVQFQLAKNGELSDDVRDFLLDTSDPFVHLALLHPHQGLSAEQIEDLLARRSQETSSLLAAAAKNPALSLDRRMDLALEARDPRVLDAVINTLTADELVALANSRNKGIQQAASAAIVNKSMA